jgi:2-amino-4-hydroxy-6-hydroxymethyldihydropteridine diphosphokinase
MAVTCYIGCGSNLGDLLSNCEGARAKIATIAGVESLRCSQFYHSEPLTIEGTQDQPWYLNCVFEIKTTLPLHALFAKLKDVENDLGRVERTKWASRIIDLDILFYDSLIYEDAELHIPHREISHRRFVLLPLCDLAPEFQHPEYQMSLSEMLAATQDKLAVRIYGTATPC